MVQVREYLRSAIWQVCKVTTREALQQKGMDILVGGSQLRRPAYRDGRGSAYLCKVSAKKVIIVTGYRGSVFSQNCIAIVVGRGQSIRSSLSIVDTDDYLDILSLLV
jgi:hypothetical protein